MRFLLLAVLAASVCGCNLIYKLPTRQGNVIEQAEIDKLKLGMTRDQVRFVLGTPMAANSMQPNRWDYLGYYKNPRGKTFSRTVSLYFDGDALVRMEGTEAPASATPAEMTEPTPGEQNPADQRPPEPETGVVIPAE